jgi:hypothetical protein
MKTEPDFGAFVISLDFELHWGVRDHQSPDGSYRANLLGVRQAIPALLELFKEFEISATWATVGFLFANSKSELQKFKPRRLPDYDIANLSPYQEPIGENEQDDPLHFAPSLVRLIQQTPRQTIGTHTFSHYYCLETGSCRESFAADLESAIRIADEYNIRPTSIVFPRNQHNPDFDEILLAHNITCYRGNPPSRMYQATGKDRKNTLFRAGRLADAYLNLTGNNTFGWNEVWEKQQRLANVPGSLFLRPVSNKLQQLESLRRQRIVRSLGDAAKQRRVFHLWWHPHNFGVNLEANIAFLRSVLLAFRDYREKYGLRSMSMEQVTAQAKNTRQHH